ncbi:MGMT family protein [Pedobacter sp. SYP-B3415]|uniref:MGMT family protein n=1 Tax=Pedobacter sp. SYP-B3415 TaxID=2496641 RepID=UPI00101B5C5D|nr:MGMT family protein [Pedobacter sp. SYP-B3415]
MFKAFFTVLNKKQDFIDQVYHAISLIPPGRVTTYGAIARALGAARSSRLVGTACIMAQDSGLPIHRVVNRLGMLTGKQHYATDTKMQQLLEAEGIQIRDDRVIDFDKLFWDPLMD